MAFVVCFRLGRLALLACCAAAGALAPARADTALPSEIAVEFAGTRMELVLIRPGTFMMGSAAELGDGDESPAHRVTLTKPFYLGKFEVMQEQWTAVMGSNPSTFPGARRPVETVSWTACRQFLARLSALTGRRFTFPTEAQWEYACRAGTETPWSCGPETDLPAAAWFAPNAGGATHAVGGKRPNAWGLYDMHGNVGEWCADWYRKHTYDRGPVTDPWVEPAPGHSPIRRGGSWGDDANALRAAYRDVSGVDDGHHAIGLRCVLLVDDAAPTPAAP